MPNTSRSKGKIEKKKIGELFKETDVRSDTSNLPE